MTSTRIAGSDPDLWEQILGANSAAVLSELHQVRDELAVMIQALEAAPGSQSLRAQLERGVAGMQKIPGKHGARPVTYSQVVVEIPDQPGALGRLFSDVGAAGVNVEDISIEHDQVRQVGYLALVGHSGPRRGLDPTDDQPRLERRLTDVRRVAAAARRCLVGSVRCPRV